jgi:glycerol-3-phosphate responsive antiterminator
MVERNDALKNIKNLVQDIKANRITAINVVDLVKTEGVKTPGAFTSLLKVVYKGNISTKLEVHKDIEKGKNESFEQEL